ncbi:BREX system ATP-binding protein BrxD [Agromyces mariniharenae]|uniref:BREX system ATP-binding protein BrxD n=1 Tax=Agromyces mariniharenae TaxID=2604423 RepID=A0A5S4V9M2_9MICO|nr:BREX system ATP-binding protein BrxD [Agromyces mariniharenae]TYL54031.1 BREX system ATP-binding protein BrxD [Agromyces mariniharenae]
MDISPRRRRDIIDALRRGTVPDRGLDVMAVGLDRFDATVRDELDAVAQGGASFKAVRGEYGSGKTFFARWLSETAKKQGFATAEIQISETETPLHRLETVYRRIIENLATAEAQPSAFREVIDGWFHVLEGDAIDAGANGADPHELATAADALMERRLSNVSKTAPAFATALRGYRAAVRAGDAAQAEGLLAWLAGQPHVAAAVRRGAGVRGELDHFGALGFLQGLLTVLRDSDYRGLVVILDEVETLQRVRSDVREKSLNSLRQLVDEVDAGRFPGLYILITGTPAFFDGPQGMQRLPPLAQRIAADFSGDPRFDNPRAPQVRLTGFTETSLHELGARIREVYASGQPTQDRLLTHVDDAFLTELGSSIAGQLGGRVGVAPRLYLRRLVDILDRVDQFEEYEPRRDALGAIPAADMTAAELAVTRFGGEHAPAGGVDDVDLDV